MLFEEENKTIDINVHRLQRAEGLNLNFRFRNKADLIEFANLIDAPELKSMKYNGFKKITWYADKNTRDKLNQFFED